MIFAACLLLYGGWIVIAYLFVLGFRILPGIESGDGFFASVRREWLAVFRWPGVAIGYLLASMAIVVVSIIYEWDWYVLPFVGPALGTPVVIALSGVEGALRQRSWRSAVWGLVLMVLSLPILFATVSVTEKVVAPSRDARTNSAR